MKSKSSRWTTNRAVDFFSDPRRALLAAGVLHLATTLLVFAVGKSQVYSQQFDSTGVGHFALDGYIYRTQADSLAATLWHGGVWAWLRTRAEFHVKLYSLGAAVFRPLTGANILTAEPLNLFFYLAILVLTFRLAKRVAGKQVAWLASAIVALWPSLLLHTTQFLRDPLFIAAMLALVLVLTNFLTKVYTWARGLAAAMIGVSVSLVLWMTRNEMWLAVRTAIFLALALFAIRMWRERKLLPGNLLGIIFLFAVTMVATLTIPPPPTTPQLPGVSVASARPPINESLPLWARIAKRRHGFIKTADYGQSGSNIDTNLEFSSAADVVKYIPRAAEIGCLAPFPTMWFTPGYNVGLIGRLLAAGETLTLYGVEVLALTGLWQQRRQLAAWLLALSAAICVTALGLVVVNIGALYRMRYAFSILFVILAATVVGRRLKPDNRRLAKPEAVRSI